MSSLKKGFKAPVLQKTENEIIENSETSDISKKEQKGDPQKQKPSDLEGILKKKRNPAKKKGEPQNDKPTDLEGIPKKERKLKKPEKSLTNSQYEDIFVSVLANLKSYPNSPHNTPECKDNYNENTPVKQTADNTLLEMNDVLATPKKKTPQENDLETPKSQHKPSSQSSVWGSHFRKNPSQVSSLLKDFQESQKSLVASSSLLSPETTASSSAEEEEEGIALASQNSVRQCSQVSGFGSQNSPTCAEPAVITTDQRTRLEQLQQCRNVGLWVFCCRPSCQKQRYLATITDPQDVPELWYCHMNPDPKYNHCQAPEQQLSQEEEEDMIYNEFTAGSVVWARVAGYPWWPAMVDDDPDLEQYYWLEDDLKTVTHYHVVFFDEVTVTRAWVNLKNISTYARNENRYKTVRARGLDYKRRILVAKEQANDAVTLTTPMRLKTYSFIARFKGPITTSDKDVKQTMTKYKLKIKVSKETKSKVNVSPKEENKGSKKRSADKTATKETSNNAGESQKKKRDQSYSILNEEREKSLPKKVNVPEKSDHSLKRKEEEYSDSEVSLPVKKRFKSLFEKKVEKLMKKRKPRIDPKKMLSKDVVDKDITEETNTTKDMKISVETNQSKTLNLPKEAKETNHTSDKKSDEFQLEVCEDKLTDGKRSPSKSNKSTKSNAEKTGSQKANPAGNSLVETPKETCVNDSLFVNTSKLKLSVDPEDVNPSEEPQPSTSAVAKSGTSSGVAEPSKLVYHMNKPHLENTEDSIGSFVEPSQVQVVTRDDMSEEKHSQSTITDFMANLSEDAVVPEAPLSQLSEPFEE